MSNGTVGNPACLGVAWRGGDDRWIGRNWQFVPSKKRLLHPPFPPFLPFSYWTPTNNKPYRASESASEPHLTICHCQPVVRRTECLPACQVRLYAIPFSSSLLPSGPEGTQIHARERASNSLRLFLRGFFFERPRNPMPLCASSSLPPDLSVFDRSCFVWCIQRWALFQMVLEAAKNARHRLRPGPRSLSGT